MVNWVGCDSPLASIYVLWYSLRVHACLSAVLCMHFAREKKRLCVFVPYDVFPDGSNTGQCMASVVHISPLHGHDHNYLQYHKCICSVFITI